MSSTAGIGAEIDRNMIGIASGSCFCTTGGSDVSGSTRMTGSTLARTSCAATSGFFDSSKVIVTLDCPSVEVDRSSSIPATVLTAASMRSVTSASMLSGVAPGFVVLTETTGVSIRGYRSTPSWKKLTPPTTTIAAMSIVAKTGRWTQTSASFCMCLLARPER